MQQTIQQRIQTSIAVKEAIIQSPELLDTIQKCVTTISETFKKGNRLWLCGNGGSAADAQHLAAEFSGRFYKDRAALPAEALHVNTSYLTAAANDYGYEEVYARLLSGVAQQGDMLIGLSTSGNSQNILNAFKIARQKKVTTIGFTGSTGGKIADVTDLLINVPSNDTPRIQESHILVGHIICELVEANLFS